MATVAHQPSNATSVLPDAAGPGADRHSAAGTGAAGSDLDDISPPGERYFRHPGDLVRLLLFSIAAAFMGVLIGVATSTSEGVSDDLGRAAAHLSDSVRELLLALTQVVSVAVPLAVVAALVARRRWRRLGVVLLAAGCGAGAWLALATALDVRGRLDVAVSSGTWIASTRFPSVAYLAGAASIAIASRPWMSRQWGRTVTIAVAALAVVMAIAGTAGGPELLLAVLTGAGVGTALLVLVGAPNRRPGRAVVATALREAGLDVSALSLQRASEGRSQLYKATLTTGDSVFVKVYSQESRDADLLYCGYRTLLLRGPNDNWPSLSLKHDVEREAFLLLLANRAGVASPAVRDIAELPDGSMMLALDHIVGPRLDELSSDDISDQLLESLWIQVAMLHAARLVHRSLRAANVLIGDRGPVIIDFGFAERSTAPNLQALDRAELLASSAALVGAPRAVAAAARGIGAEALAACVPYLQPLALSAATRRVAPKGRLRELRQEVAVVSGQEPVPLAQLVRVRPKTLLMIAASAGAFYVLLPQLAHVGDSVGALESVNWGWLAVAVVMSAVTYVASAVGVIGGVREHLPFAPVVNVQMASSFVNRVTPANVGGMALNVRFLQKAGVPPPDAVTGVGLNSAVGAIVHLVLLVIFFAWAGQKNSFSVPASSKLLAGLAVALALVGIVAVTRKGRSFLRTTVVTFIRRSWTSMLGVAKSPSKLSALFGGSLGVTLAYIAAMDACVLAVHGHLTIAQVGAVYLGASLIAAAAPTPGGLGALEAAVVAGLTGVGMASGPAVAAVLVYRLVTYWLPIAPGWYSFRLLERQGLI